MTFLKYQQSKDDLTNFNSFQIKNQAVWKFTLNSQLQTYQILTNYFNTTAPKIVKCCFFDGHTMFCKRKPANYRYSVCMYTYMCSLFRLPSSLKLDDSATASGLTFFLLFVHAYAYQRDPTYSSASSQVKKQGQKSMKMARNL